jgi:hypothetical protein
MAPAPVAPPRPGSAGGPTTEAGGGTGAAAGSGGGPAATAPGEPPGAADEEDPNHLDPGALFECRPDSPVASPPRVWRLTGAQYEAMAAKALDLYLARFNYGQPLQTLADAHRFTNLASLYGMDTITVEGALSAASVLADRYLPGAMQRSACLRATPLLAGCVSNLLVPIAERGLRRPLPLAEREALVQLVLGAAPTVERQEALKLGVLAILASPEFLFRREIGGPEREVSGRRRLAPYEVASAVALTLTDGAPDAELLKAAAEDRLRTAEEIRPHVLRLLKTPNRGSVVRLFSEIFKYSASSEVFKDPVRYRDHNTSIAFGNLNESARLLLADALAEPKGALARVLTTPVSFINQRTAYSHSLPKPAESDWVRVELPPDQRAGILTHPAFLVAKSQADENDPIRRGRFVREWLLCQTVPEVPLEVVPALPELPKSTLRERLAEHTKDGSCKGCHALIDPIGLAFEHYDHIGRWRTTEEGRPVDARGALVGTEDQDGPVDGAVQLARRLAASDTVRRCFVRQSFRYWLGRNERLTDACTLARAYEAFKKDDDLVELVASLLTSDSFLYRTSSAEVSR